MDNNLNSESILLSSARVTRLKCDDLTDALSWSGLIDPLLPYFNNILPETLSELCSALNSSSASRLKSLLKEDNKGNSFYLTFKASAPDSTHLIVVTSGNTTNKECFFHVLDCEPHKVDDKLNHKAKNELETTEEWHHRAKNILQSIISYLNLLIIGRDNLPKKEIDRVIHYVHVLAAQHDVLHDQLLNQNQIDLLRLDRVLLTLFSRFSVNNNITWNEIPNLVVRSARAASLSLFLIKIISLICEDIDRDTSVTIQVQLVAGNRARIEVSRNAKSDEIDFTKLELVPGMRIIQLLLKADRQSSFDLGISGDRLSALFEFQIDLDDSNSTHFL